MKTCRIAVIHAVIDFRENGTEGIDTRVLKAWILGLQRANHMLAPVIQSSRVGGRIRPLSLQLQQISDEIYLRLYGR